MGNPESSFQQELSSSLLKTMAFALLFTTLLACLCIKRLLSYLHSTNHLRKYPSLTPLSGLTSLSYLYYRSHPFRTRHLYLKHKKHPIIRLGPKNLSFASVQAIKDIYGHGTPCRKDDVYHLTMGSHANVLNVVDPREHARKRRMLAHAFAARNLEGWEGKIGEKVGRLVMQLDRRCTCCLGQGGLVEMEDVTVDFRLWANLFTVDTIVDLALSEKLGMLDSGRDMVAIEGVDGAKYIDSLHCGGRFVSTFVGATDWFRFLKTASIWLSPYLRSQWERGQNFGRIVCTLVDRRLRRQQCGDQLDDFFDCLMTDKSGKARCLERGEIEAETGILLDAGSDTTAIALTHILYYLIKNPCCLTKLRKEVASAISEGTIPPYAGVKSLPYLKACINESLRLSPPVSRGVERRTPSGGMQIAGETIPGDVAVSVPTYVVQRDTTVFPEPDEYRPERWLEGGEKAKQMRDAFIPFSTGARGCIGRNLSMMEQQIVVATLVHRYDFALPSDDWELEWEEAFLLWPAKMPLKIWRRDVSVC